MTRRSALAACAGSAVMFGAPSQPRVIRLAVRTSSDEPADPKTIRVEFDRAEAKVVRVLTPADPQMLLIVLDTVGDLAAIDPAKEALISEIGQLPTSTYAGLLRAQDGMSVLVDPGPGREPVVNGIRDLAISGRPGLLEALEPVAKLADSISKKAQVRVAVLHVSDSDVREYREDFTNPVINSSDPHDLSRRFPETLIQEKMTKFEGRFLSFETPVHLVHLTYRSDRLNEAYRNGLQRLAEITNGSAVFCRSRAEIGDAIAAAFRIIRSEYGLIVALPDRVPDTVQIKASSNGAALAHRARLRVKEK